MKMAKATARDIEGALAVCRLVDALEDRQLPDDMAPGDEIVWYDENEHAAKVVEYLMRCVAGVSLFRVVFGMAVLLDDANEIVDPAASALELHPKHQSAQSRIASIEADIKAAWATNRAIDNARQEEMRRRDQLTTALVKAESFIAGFENDELQDDVNGLLETIRNAIAGKTAKVSAGSTAPYHDHPPSRDCECPACADYFKDKPIGCDFAAGNGGVAG